MCVYRPWHLFSAVYSLYSLAAPKPHLLLLSNCRLMWAACICSSCLVSLRAAATKCLSLPKCLY